MKKLIALLLTVSLVSFSLGCDDKGDGKKDSKNDSKKKDS